jgi:hypothetical protein
MTYRVPVIATDTSSMRKGVGEAAMSIAVHHIEAVGVAMRPIIVTTPLRAARLERAMMQTRRCTGQRCAQHPWAVYDEVYARSRSGHGAQERP